jgi:hypothetical protein
MKVTLLALLALLVIGTLSQLNNVANKPLPICIKGTSSNFYLDGIANTNYVFRSVSVPDFVQISPDGLLTYNAKNVGAWGIDVKIQDKKTG